MKRWMRITNRSVERRCYLIAVAVAFLLCAPTLSTGEDSALKVVEIAIGDNMRYTPAVIDAQPGQRLRVILKAAGKIQALSHNLVLLKKGADPKSFVDRTAADAGETGVVPPATAGDVIVALPLVKSGATDEVTFEAPRQPGEYVFVCTFPGHFNLGMKGRLIVK
jgi:azurin